MFYPKKPLSAATLALALGTVSHASIAAPQISSTQGELQAGATMTISGSNFTNVDILPGLYDLVDNINLYQTLPDGTTVTDQNSAWNGTSTEVYGRTPPILVKSGDLRYNNGVAAYQGAVSFLERPKGISNSGSNTLYVSWYFKPDYLVGGSEANKYIRIWDRMDGNGTRISWTSMHLTYAAKEINYSPNPSWSGTSPPANEWSHLEIYVDANANLIEARLNGKLRHRVTDFKKSPNAENLNIGLIGFDPVDNGKYVGTTFRMKDIYVSNTQARVEVSNSPQWDPEARREIVSYNSWSDNSIEINLNNAALSLDNKYLYVYDAAGNVNQTGFPLCEQCPTPPSSITIQ